LSEKDIICVEKKMKKDFDKQMNEYD